MTPLENFHRIIDRRDPQWLPLELPFTPPVRERLARSMGTTDLAPAFKLDFRYVGIGAAGDVNRWRKAFVELGYTLPEGAEIGQYGGAELAPPPDTVGEATHFRTMLHPLQAVTDVAQLPSLPWPEIAPAAAVERAAERTAQHHVGGHVVNGCCECTTFEPAWYVRGMDNLFMDLVEDNGIAQWLFDFFTQRSIKIVRGYVRAGCDVIELGDDVGTQRGMMMSVDTWREHLRPRLKQVIDAIRAEQGERRVLIRYHSDGDIRAIIDDLIEIGVDILNPLQPECMPVDEVINQYKDRLAFWGVVGTQTVMPFGTPDQVRQVVRDCARHVDNGAAVVVAPTHVLEPEVPDENIHALVQAVRETKLATTVK